MTTHVYPDYYNSFRCIASKCKHNCCIGWEIDIDDNTLDFYNSVEGDFQKRLKANVSCEDTPHFVLTKNERCPFLSSDNLCDIITTLGEEHLCDICAEHPRFHNELPNRMESGLGLCCEQACRIILLQKDSMTLCYNGESKSDDEIINMRDHILTLLQQRDKDIVTRLDDMMSYCKASLTEKTLPQWFELLKTLEQLSPEWTQLLNYVTDNYDKADTAHFDTYMKERESEYEQFCAYLLYRHFANSPDVLQAQRRAAFIKLSYTLLYTIGCVLYCTLGEFSVDTQLEIARLFSSEIEYSDENLYYLFDMVI